MYPQNDTLQAVQSNTVLTITLPEPYLGGLSRGALDEFASLLSAASQSSEIRAVVVTGHHNVFCLGVDLDEFVDGSGLENLAASLRGCFQALAHLEVPFLAAVSGRAVGFGLSMLCHADVVIASPNARFEAPFVNLGVLPEAASTVLLPQRLGYLQAFRMLCLGEHLTATAAKSLGLVTEIDDDPIGHAMALARRLVKRSPGALIGTRQLLRGPPEQFDSRIELELTACYERLQNPTVRQRIDRLAGIARRQAKKENQETV